MPTYSYECQKCGNVRDEFHAMSANPKVACTECGGSMKRLLGTGAGVIFKGSGFYETDYKNKSGSSKSGSNGSSKTESKSESKPSTKTDSSSAKKAD